VSEALRAQFAGQKQADPYLRSIEAFKKKYKKIKRPPRRLQLSFRSLDSMN